MNSSREVPGRRGEQRKVRRPLPASRLAGGEGWVGENEEENEAHPWVPLVREEVAGGGGSAEDGALAAVCNGGDGAPVDNGRREAAKKMREGEAELAVGLARAKRQWRRGSTAA